ncbi:MAG: energy transducer TonB [Myxococcota bacterium]
MRLAVALTVLTLLAVPAGMHGTPPSDSVDLLPLGPSPEARLEEIRRRVQDAVVYPARARELGLEGTTRIQFQVGNDGRAHEVATVESSGYGLLDRAAERGALEARELPPLYGRIRIPIRFELRDRN